MAEKVKIELRAGQQRSLPLRGAATAGYRWFASVGGPDPDAIGVEVRRGDLPPGTAPGHSVPEEATITALKPGRALARLELRRPWEPEDRVAEAVEIEADVVAGDGP
jgi:predicted secreted protein